jgi:hypothetical protein
MSIMWFYDEAGEWSEYQDLRQAVRSLEGEYLEIRILLRDADKALRLDPDNDYLKAKINYLSKRLLDLEKKAPRLSSDIPLEIALFSPPHG